MVGFREGCGQALVVEISLHRKKSPLIIDEWMIFQILIDPFSFCSILDLKPYSNWRHT